MVCGKICYCCGRKCTRDVDHVGYCASVTRQGKVGGIHIFYGIIDSEGETESAGKMENKKTCGRIRVQVRSSSTIETRR